MESNANHGQTQNVLSNYIFNMPTKHTYTIKYMYNY